jgi:hypothetical protein
MSLIDLIALFLEKNTHPQPFSIYREGGSARRDFSPLYW